MNIQYSPLAQFLKSWHDILEIFFPTIIISRGRVGGYKKGVMLGDYVNCVTLWRECYQMYLESNKTKLSLIHSTNKIQRTPSQLFKSVTLWQYYIILYAGLSFIILFCTLHDKEPVTRKALQLTRSNFDDSKKAKKPKMESKSELSRRSSCW